MPGLIRISALDSNVRAGSAVPYARFSMTATANSKTTPGYISDGVNCTITRIKSGIVEVVLDTPIADPILSVYSSPLCGAEDTMSAILIDDAGWQTRSMVPGTQSPDYTYDSSTGTFSISTYIHGAVSSGDGDNQEPFQYKNLFREIRNSTDNKEYPNPFHIHGIVFNPD